MPRPAPECFAEYTAEYPAAVGEGDGREIVCGKHGVYGEEIKCHRIHALPHEEYTYKAYQDIYRRSCSINENAGEHRAFSRIRIQSCQRKGKRTHPSAKGTRARHVRELVKSRTHGRGSTDKGRGRDERQQHKERAEKISPAPSKRSVIRFHPLYAFLFLEKRPQVFFGVGRLSVLVYLKVQMRSCRSSGFAYKSDRLSPLYSVPLKAQKLACMCIQSF